LLENGKFNDVFDFVKNKTTDAEKSQSDEFNYYIALGLYYDGKYDKSRTFMKAILERTKDEQKYNKLFSILKVIEVEKDKANEVFKKRRL